MRVQHRGGLWTNAEDEVLKAALQKYGSNQWSRIASLLPRKSAKQVKARWNEWLSPSIRKTEWTREEEERLLHLAKIMPTQWRTIAPMVGRTAAQCLEHYELLLEDAQRSSAAADGDGSGRSAGEALAAAGEARRARYDHEIAAESKPARPDAVDMNEEEKEMLSEARARLANTRGKKAKRKAREKQLEAAKRLAQLQKRRELKAAGIAMKPKRKKGGGYDLASEIPFARAAVPGFYDTKEEDRVNAPNVRDARGVGRLITKYDSERVEDYREKEGQRNEIKRKKVFGEGGDAKKAAAQAEPQMKRSKLSLPAPQVSDTDLEVIAKAGSSTLGGDAGGGGGDLYGTAGLLSGARHPLLATPAGSISSSLSPTPRTVNGANSERWADARDRQLRDMAKLQAANTPLVGGDNATLPASLDVNGSVTPRSMVQRSPSLMATPSVSSLGTFASKDMNDKDLARAEKARIQLLRRELKKGLDSLPDPEYEYSTAGAVDAENAGDSDSDGAGVSCDIVEDAEDEAGRITRENKKMLADTKKRALSQVASRRLPTPLAVHLALGGDEESRIVRELVDRDIAVGQVLDQVDRKGKEAVGDVELARRVKDSVLLDPDDGSLQEARRVVEEEIKRAEDDGVSGVVSEGEILKAVKKQSALLSKAFWVCNDGVSIVEAESGLDMKELFRQSSVHASLKLKSVKTQEKNSQMRLGGFEAKHRALQKELTDTFNQLTKARQELVCFSVLAEDETAAIPRRIVELQAVVDEEKALQRRLQSEYAQLTSNTNGMSKAESRFHVIGDLCCRQQQYAKELGSSNKSAAATSLQ